MNNNSRKKLRSRASTVFTAVQQMTVMLSPNINITLKHLKMCVELKKKRNAVANNKVCPECSKVFAKK